jgi:RNA polymerase sigma-70 factor (ECF subfamily)
MRSPEAGGPNRYLATTRWSLVEAAGDSADARHGDALGELCRLYWMPVRSFVRRRARDEAAADDLTQGFFATLIERGTIAAADRERGRFRAFLLTAAKFYLADQRDHAHARKRGGGMVTVSVDDEDGPLAARLSDPGPSPEREYERQWALTLLGHVRARLAEQLARERNPERMLRLAGLITGDGAERYRQIAGEVGMSESAVKVAVHRLRRRFAALLREEVARTLTSEDDIEDEIRFLLAAVSGSGP